ncbi:uncharacterized protein LOC115328106 [Ixodes scapularis]|uniref:uncharacterized protein LOC115328106 n=1 Tax=Ixodes scapularis TaxID=6945 RepID=UPI001A9EAA0D|nr:uncharacterized protein LOC115328106 [Ixodes scapularis]
MKQIEAEIRHCVETGHLMPTLLHRRRIRRRRNRVARISRCPREQPRDLTESENGDQNSSRPAPLRWPDWPVTPHAVSVRRGMRAQLPTPEAFDDTRLRQAYSTVVWRQRAERFHVDLDVEDPGVQDAMLRMQDFACV